NSDMGDLGNQGFNRRLNRQQQEEFERLSPFLAADDWIVITVDSNPLPALPGGSSSPALNLSAAVASGIPSGLLGGALPNASTLGGSAGTGAAAAGATGATPSALTPSAASILPQSGATPATTATAGGYAPAATAGPGQARGGGDTSQNAPELTDE